MTEKRSVNCCGETIEYILNRKKVKNINMRVSPERGVLVSAPNRVSSKFIDDFVRSRRNFILSSLERLSQNRFEEPDVNKIYSDGDSIHLFGDVLTVKTVFGDTDSVDINDGELTVQTFDTENMIYINKLIRNFIYNCTAALFKELNDEISGIFNEKYGIEKVPIKLRRMKSRWGSCHVNDKFIVMNTRLIFYPRESARYVFIHEYAHFIEPNHSSSFYNIVRSVMPDYRVYSDMLK